MEDIIKKVREALRSHVDEQTLRTGQRFFKEKIKLYGVKVPVVNKISREYCTETGSKSRIWVLCETLWKSGYLEESLVACNWSYYIHDRYEPDDFSVFELWLRKYVDNWASCDTLCNHTIGQFVEMYPEFVGKLKAFATSRNRWVRRAAAVSLIIPARKGKFLDDILEIADLLLQDTDDLVQKGYGWMLKAASEAHQDEVFDYVIHNKGVMARTALRYAIEKMPSELKISALEKHQLATDAQMKLKKQC